MVPFADWVGEGLATLRRELPWAYERMAAALGRREVALSVDGEVVAVVSDGARAWLRDRPEAPTVTLSTSRREIVALVDAERTLVTSVLRGETVLRGRVDDLAAFHDGLLEFLRGAVRSPSFPWMMDAFRRDVVSTAAAREARAR